MKKNIIVTGGAQGIGRIVTKQLLEHGYRVSVLEADEEAVQEMKESCLTDDILILKTDVADSIQVKAAMEYATEKFGRIDGLINNAAVMVRKPLTELMPEEWNRAISVNLSGPFFCVKYAASELRRNRGAVINICSTRAIQSEADTESYSASKGGLLSLTHALSVSLGPDVRVNAISPGWIDVSAIKKRAAVNPEKLSEADHLQHPAGRVGKPEDIAAMILFLLDEKNDFITGQNFIIDGGMTRKMIYV